MAIFYSKGTISSKSEIKSGVSAKGTSWSRMTIMLDVPGYNGSITKMSFNVGTDRIEDINKIPEGTKVEIGWVIYAREFNGKWYNNVDLVNVKVEGQNVPQASPIAPNAADLDTDAHGDDLPF